MWYFQGLPVAVGAIYLLTPKTEWSLAVAVMQLHRFWSLTETKWSLLVELYVSERDPRQLSRCLKPERTVQVSCCSSCWPIMLTEVNVLFCFPFHGNVVSLQPGSHGEVAVHLVSPCVLNSESLCQLELLSLLSWSSLQSVSLLPSFFSVTEVMQDTSIQPSWKLVPYHWYGRSGPNFSLPVLVSISELLLAFR